MYSFLQPRDDGLPLRSSGQWALEKLDYLRRYIEVFETSMRQGWSVRNYVDILCGPGKVQIRESGTITFGSPLLALTAQHPFTGYYFVDANPDNTAALRSRCDASPLGERVRIYTNDCNVVVNEIVAELRETQQQSLNLAFLEKDWNLLGRRSPN